MKERIFKFLLERFKKFILPEQNKKSSQKTFSNQNLYEEILVCFKQNLENESVGRKMLYPTTFNILLNPDDFNHLEKALPFLVKEIVNKFYETIKEYKIKYPDYSSPAKSWHFQFSPCNEIMLNKEMETIERGAPIIMAELYNYATGNNSNNSTTINTRLSLKPRNSDVYSTYDINNDAFNGVDVIAAGVFSIRFDKELNSLSYLPDHQGNNVFAEITYNEGGLIKHYKMIDKEISISGSKDLRKETWVMIIHSESIVNGHANIRYDQLTKSFQIATYGPLIVNERNIEISEMGSPKWYPLTENAKLSIGNASNYTALDFSASK